MKSWRRTFITITIVSLFPIEIKSIGNWNSADGYDSQQRKRREEEWNDWLFERPGEPGKSDVESENSANNENAVNKEENAPPLVENSQSQGHSNVNSNGMPENSQNPNQISQQQQQNNQQQIQPFGHHQNHQQNPHLPMQHQNQHQNPNFRPENNFQVSSNQFFQPNPPLQNLNQQQQAQFYQQQQQQQQQINQHRPPNGVYPGQPHHQGHPHHNFHNQGQGHHHPPHPQLIQGQGQKLIYPPNQPHHLYPYYPPQTHVQPFIPQINNNYAPIQGPGQNPHNPRQPGQPGQLPFNPAVVNPQPEKITTTSTTKITTTSTTTTTTAKNLYLGDPDYVKPPNPNPGPETSEELNPWLFDVPAPANQPQGGINPINNFPDPNQPVQDPANPQQGPDQMPVHPAKPHQPHPHVYPVPLIHPPQEPGESPYNPQKPVQPPFNPAIINPEPETAKIPKTLYLGGPEYKPRNPDEQPEVNPFLVDVDAYKYNNYNRPDENQRPLLVVKGNQDDNDGIRAEGHLPNKYQIQDPPGNGNQNNYYGNNNDVDPILIDSYGSYLSNHAHIHRADDKTNQREKTQEKSWKDRFMSLIHSKKDSDSNPDLDSSAVSLIWENSKVLWVFSFHFLWFKMLRLTI